jgi:NADH-ubiquinone oxidoreductase chain 3
MEKLRPFECGFSPKYTPRLPFSIRFLLIAILFLVFDVELVVIFPIMVRLLRSFFFGRVGGLFLILLILLAGLAHE